LEVTSLVNLTNKPDLLYRELSLPLAVLTGVSFGFAGCVIAILYTEFLGVDGGGQPALIGIVLLSAWLFGTFAGLTSAVLAATFVVLYEYAPRWSFSVGQQDVWLLIEFVFVTTLVAFFSISRRKRETELIHARQQRDEVIKILEDSMQRLDIAKREAENALGLAEAALSVKDDFLSMTSHELQGPLTIIMGNANLLGALPMSNEDTQLVRKEILNQTERLSQMIDGMLTLARLGPGDSLPGEPIRLEHVLPGLLEKIQQRISRTGPIVLTIGANLPIIEMSISSLEQIIGNLVSNSDKYSPKYEPIDIDVEGDVGEVKIFVADRGPGVAPSELEAMFGPFYRSTKTDSLAPGLGIGLTVCKRLVEAFGGSIKAELRETRGLVVCITFRALQHLEEE
jgi:K+-sensing histidine kinase KdpD